MTPLFYSRKGAGRPLVLVHGYLGGSAIWAALAGRFAAYRDVICPDLAGFGQSAGLTAPDSITAHARDVLALLDSLDVTEFDLLGHSMGGMVVQEMVRLEPHRVGRLVLYGTGPQGNMPGRFETIAQSRAGLQRDGIAATARRIAATWFRAGEAAPEFDLCHVLGQKVALQTGLASLTAWEDWDGRAALSAVPCPTLVIWGSHDRSYNWSQPEALWRGIAGADLAVVPDAAHNVHLEKPALFAALLADFLGLCLDDGQP